MISSLIVMEDNKSIIEALLFVSPEPLSLKQISELLDNVSEQEIQALLDTLASEYEERQGGLQVVKIAEGYQMLTRLDCSPWLRKLKTITVSSKLSQAALETLSVIAYKQPTIKAEIDKTRGVSSDGVLRTLLDRKFIKILGRQEVPGRPLLYGTTNEFLQYFGLKNISELPTLRDIEDIDGIESSSQPSMEDILELDAEASQELEEEAPPSNTNNKVPEHEHVEESE